MDEGMMTAGDRLLRFFLKGVWQGVKTALVPHARLHDPLEPMPTVPEWLASYGVTPEDTSAFDRCEADWYRLLEQRRRRTDAYLAGMFAGTCLYALSTLALIALIGWTIYELIPFDGFGKLLHLLRG